MAYINNNVNGINSKNIVYKTPLSPYKSNEQSHGKYIPTKSPSNKGLI